MYNCSIGNGATGGTLIRIRQERGDRLGLTISTALGLGAGLFAGLVAGELLGNLNPQRLRRVLGRLGRQTVPPMDSHALERAVADALRASPSTQQVAAQVHALGDGLVELTGTAPDAASRRAAGDTARGVPGAEVVVNRILIEGDEVPVRKSAPPNAR